MVLSKSRDEIYLLAWLKTNNGGSPVKNKSGRKKLDKFFKQRRDIIILHDTAGFTFS